MNFVKKNSRIIVLCGKAQSGKNLVANIIRDYYNDLGLKSAVISYAFYLKNYAKNILGWDGNENSKPRDFLQQVGVELIKNRINPNMLIDRVIDDIKVYSYFFDVIIISDARFIDEIQIIRDRFSNVFVVHINGNSNNLNDKQRNHSTETGLDNFFDYDYDIDNFGNIDELKNKVCEVLK